MRGARLVLFDARNGIVRCWYHYGAVLAVFAMAALSLWSIAVLSGCDEHPRTFGDCFVYAFAGMKEYLFMLGIPFDFPALWTLVFLVAAYLTLNYPYRDLMGAGKHQLVESGSRPAWWYSKCCWVVASVVLFYAMAAVSLALFVLLFGGSITLEVSPDIVSLIDFGGDILPGPWDIASLMVLLPTMTAALCLLQLMLSLALKPLPGFLCTIALLFFSSYFKNPLLPGNYLMVARSDVFIASGVGWVEGTVFALGIAVFAVVLGRILFARMDIMEKE